MRANNNSNANKTTAQASQPTASKTASKTTTALTVAINNETQVITIAGRLIDMANAPAVRKNALASLANADAMSDALAVIPDGPAKDAGLSAIMTIRQTANAQIEQTKDADANATLALSQLKAVVQSLNATIASIETAIAEVDD